MYIGSKNKLLEVLNMSNVNDQTCLGSKKYRGFYIDYNINEDFATPYYSVINPAVTTVRNGKTCSVHVHTTKQTLAKRIVDCYYSNNKAKYGMNIRNKAMSLDGTRVLF